MPPADPADPSDPSDVSELQGYGAAARHAVALAEAEARTLGHDRVGTEHLLLGLLANDTSGAAGALRDAGLHLAAARHKVGEAVGPAVAVRPGRLERTARASRALGRAVRFSHTRRSDEVKTEHVLLGVLDVEGTAGQVLRGLGVDVDRLRAALESGDSAGGDGTGEPAGRTAPDEEGGAERRGGGEPEPPERQAVACPSCAAPLAGALQYETVTADGDAGARDIVVLSCAACGRFLGTAAPRRAPGAAPGSKRR